MYLEDLLLEDLLYHSDKLVSLGEGAIQGPKGTCLMWSSKAWRPMEGALEKRHHIMIYMDLCNAFEHRRNNADHDLEVPVQCI